MTQDKSRNHFPDGASKRLELTSTYYDLLDLPTVATADDIRRAYRQKSKLYHPDTTTLPPEEAIAKFRALKEAYAILNNPERRALYDSGQGATIFSRLHLEEKESALEQARRIRESAAYLDAKERPLSPGEIFAVFLLVITFLVCLVVAVILGVARGEMVLQASAKDNPPVLVRTETQVSAAMPESRWLKQPPSNRFKTERSGEYPSMK